MGRRLALLVAALAVALTACNTGATPAQLAELPDIEGIEQLATDFSQDDGSPRLILLLSPT